MGIILRLKPLALPFSSAILRYPESLVLEVSKDLLILGNRPASTPRQLCEASSLAIVERCAAYFVMCTLHAAWV